MIMEKARVAQIDYFDFDRIVWFYEDVLWFQISMDDVQFMQYGQRL